MEGRLGDVFQPCALKEEKAEHRHWQNPAITVANAYLHYGQQNPLTGLKVNPSTRKCEFDRFLNAAGETG